MKQQLKIYLGRYYMKKFNYWQRCIIRDVFETRMNHRRIKWWKLCLSDMIKYWRKRIYLESVHHRFSIKEAAYFLRLQKDLKDRSY